VQANDVKDFDNTMESCKAQWVNIVFQLFRNLPLWMFFLISRRRRFGKKSLMHQQLDQVAEIERYNVEEETAS
jgi:hypothetical protein